MKTVSSTAPMLRTQSQSTRRALVLGRFITAGVAALWWVFLATKADIHHYGLLALALVHIGLGFGLYWKSAIWKLANAPADQLDERECQVQASAYVVAYRYIATVVIVGAIALTEVAPETTKVLLESAGTGWFILLLISFLFLPSDIIAWQEKEV